MKQSRRFVSVMPLILCCLMTACATPYQSTGFAGGFSETQMAPDVFRVHFNGNGYTSAERAQDYALLRAAELTLASGFKYFAPLNAASSTSVSTITTPGVASTTGSVSVSGGYATYAGTTIYTPGATFNVYKPHTGLLIRCFVAQPAGLYTFDATFLQQTLKHKYQITRAEELQPDTAPTEPLSPTPITRPPSGRYAEHRPSPEA